MEQNTSTASHTNHATWRAIVLGLALSIPHGYFSIQTPTPSTVSLIYPAIISLTALVLLNLALKRWLQNIAFSQGELLTIYTMLSISVAIAGLDLAQVVSHVMSYAHWAATPENEWQSLFFRYLPRWLVVDDVSVLKGLYEADSSLYNWAYIKAWMTPVLWWGMMLFALMVVMLGMNIFIKKQWIEHERLSYPIIQLPLAMARDGGNGRFFLSFPLWLGIAVAGGISLINGLHSFFPNLPLIPVRTIEIGRYFTEKPFSAIGRTRVCFFPFVVGLSYFMPLDLAFSCWFFYLVWKMEFVLGASLGLRSLPEFPYVKPQAFGSYLAISMFAIWSGRKHILSALSSVFDKSSPNDEGDPRHYRMALAFIFAGIAFIAFFCVKAGMSLWVFIIFFSIYFLLVLSLTRLRAELGPPANEFYNMGPDQMLPRIIGTRRLGGPNLTMFAMFWGFNRAHRCNPMPHQLEAFKLVEESKTNQKHLISAIILVSMLGILVAFWGFLHTSYIHTSDGHFGAQAYRNLERWLYYMPGRDMPAMGFMGGGFMLILVLAFLRRRLLWWTLHPVAYPLASSSWTMGWMWFSIFISWFAKRTLLKHGGISAYRKAIPFFLGLILGDYFIGGMWNVYGILTHKHIYTFWH
jgi:hypothetical protein